MATKKIVPRANGEGAIGDNTAGAEKYWGGGFFNNINGTNAIEMAAFNDSLQLKRSTAYVTGQIRFVSGLQAGLYLEATADGTTDSTDITIPSTVVPNTTTITDGTVTWIVRQLANTASLSQAGERQKSTIYTTDKMASLSTLPYGWYLECTTGGTTSASDLVITSPSVGDTVTDGTVVWTIREVASTADIPAPIDISGKANVDLDNLSAAGEAKIQSVSPRYLTDSYYNATTGDWYRVYSDGWVEQGGNVTIDGRGSATVTLLKPFSDSNYTLACAIAQPDGGEYTYRVTMPVGNTLTTTTFNCSNSGSGYGMVVRWMACGMGANS